MTGLRDVRRELYDVTEARPTPMGWPVYLGRPRTRDGPTQVVMTKELHAYLRGGGAAAQLPLTRSCVTRLRRRWKLSRWEPTTYPAKWWRQHARELARTSGQEFAERHGVSEGAVSRWLRQLGLAQARSRSRSPVAPERAARWAEEYRAGAALSEIAQRDGGVTSEGVRKVLLRAGVQMRPRGGARTEVPSEHGRAGGGGVASGMGIVIWDLGPRFAWRPLPADVVVPVVPVPDAPLGAPAGTEDGPDQQRRAGEDEGAGDPAGPTTTGPCPISRSQRTTTQR